MYDRKVKEEVLTLRVSGMLWQRSLVMEDLETGTLWSHHLGRGMRGELEGEELRTLPAVMLTWREWRERHPESSVLAMTRTAERFLEGVWQSPERFVYVLPGAPGKSAPAVELALLQKEGFAMVSLEETPVLLTHARDGTGVQAFEARVANRSLHFVRTAEGKLTDRETGSHWHPVNGTCLEGELKGERLPPRFGMISFREAWKAFHPGGKRIKATAAGE